MEKVMEAAAREKENRTRALRIGAVPFLNAKPLVWGLEEAHELYAVAPAQMPKLLEENRLDVSLAPVTVLWENPLLFGLQAAVIACRGEVKSVRLLHHVSVAKIKKIYVDQRSRTSVLLLKVLLSHFEGNRSVRYISVDVENFRTDQLKPWEACLQIGDTALVDAKFGLKVWDLGREWHRRTNLPFVFALWTARDAEIAEEAEPILRRAKEEGVQHFQEIVHAYPGIVDFDEPKYLAYLQNNIQYDFTPEAAEGIRLFRTLLEKEGLLSPPKHWPLPRRLLDRLGVWFNPWE